MTGRHTLRRRPAHQRAARARRLQRARRWWPPVPESYDETGRRIPVWEG